MSERRGSVQFRRLAAGYRTVALMLLNCVVLFVLLNAAVGLYFAARDVIRERRRDASDDDIVIYETIRYDDELLAGIYPDLAIDESRALLKETWSRPFEYEPFTIVRERACQGVYVNVHEAGFRHGAERLPWPPAEDSFNVFVFGGSTTFGYGVQDAQTIPAHLEPLLSSVRGEDVRVYNFGRGDYYSSQERVLFGELLLKGAVPDAAIFIDGLNDLHHWDVPVFTDRLHDVIEGVEPPEPPLLPAWLPVGRLIRRFRRASAPAPAEGLTGPPSAEIAVGVAERYVANRRLIEALAREFAVETVFVWQPVPRYRYAIENHPFVEAGLGLDAIHPHLQEGYPVVARLFAEREMGPSFLWCADAFEGVDVNLYVDHAHYSARGNEVLATRVAELVSERGLLRGGK